MEKVSADKIEGLKEFIRLQILVEDSKSIGPLATMGVPIIMASSEVAQTVFQNIANINLSLTRIAKRPLDQWLTHEQALEFFGVSENTLRGYTNRGWLSVSIVDRKKYYHMADIEKFLMHPDHRKHAFQFNK